MNFQEFRNQYKVQVETLDGGDWAFIESQGAGPTLVLLPGMQGTGELFFKQIAALGDNLRVLAVSYPPEPDAAKLADMFKSFLDARGIEKLHLLGSSLGGYWGQIFALRHPKRIETLFVANSLVDATINQEKTKKPEEIAALSPEEVREMFLGFIKNIPETSPGTIELKEIMLDQVGERRQPPETLKSRMMAMAIAPPVPKLPIPDSQVVVIDCEDDPIMSPPVRVQVRERYAGAEQHTLPSGGHYPAILRSDDYTEILRKRLLG